jgi:hypothetical protein
VVFTINIRKLVSFIAICLCLGSENFIQAQETNDMIGENASYVDSSYYLLKIEEGWTHQGRPLSIPFSFASLDEAVLKSTFILPDSFPAPLFLHIERASWDVEIEINGRYLAVSEHPFRPFSVALDSAWLMKGENQIQVRLSKGESCYLCPRQTLGLYRPLYLMTQSQVARLEKPVMKTVTGADTVGVVAPFYRRGGYAFDLFEATRTLLPLIQSPYKYIYFSFEPDRQLKILCRELGLVRVESIADSTAIGLVNYYPYEASNFPWTRTFWIDGKGRRTPVYQNFRMTHHYVRDLDLSENRNLIILLTFFPLIAFVVLKLLGAGFFESQGALLFNPKLYIDSSLNNSDTQQGWLVILQFFRLLGLTISTSLFIYFIKLTHQWELITIFRDVSLTKSFFYSSTSLTEILLRSFMIIFTWFVLKHVIILLIGSAFRIKGMFGGVMNLDILGSYPLIILLPIPASLMLFWGGPNPYLALGLMGFCGMIYMARKLYIIFLGLNRLFGFPSTMKFLYICTFNIFPYMFWL